MNPDPIEVNDGEVLDPAPAHIAGEECRVPEPLEFRFRTLVIGFFAGMICGAAVGAAAVTAVFAGAAR